jgi:hypothetical protein
MKLRLLTIVTAVALPCTYAIADNEQRSVAPVGQQPQVVDTDRTQSPGAVEPEGRMGRSTAREARRYGDDRVGERSRDRYAYRDRNGYEYSGALPHSISPVINGAQVPDSDITMSPGAAEPNGSRMSSRRSRS